MCILLCLLPAAAAAAAAAGFKPSRLWFGWVWFGLFVHPFSHTASSSNGEYPSNNSSISFKQQFNFPQNLLPLFHSVSQMMGHSSYEALHQTCRCAVIPTTGPHLPVVPSCSSTCSLLQCCRREYYVQTVKQISDFHSHTMHLDIIKALSPNEA